MTERDDVAILWDMPIQRGCDIGANRLDIVCLLIDLTIPNDGNSSVKITEKLAQYKDLEIEIE